MRALLVLILTFATLPGFLPAQSAPWRLQAGADVTSVAEVSDAGYPAIPVSALLSLGARVSYAGGDIVVRLGGREVGLRVDSPGVTAEGRTLLMGSPVYSRGGVVYVPTEFLRILAGASGGLLSVDPQTHVARVDAAALASAASTPAPAAIPATPAPAPPAQTRRLVVIDAGHGGVDPGAVGPNGTREKMVTLAVSRRVAELLRDDPRFEVRMTRDRDTLIALRDRGRFANQWRDEGQPALFLSIHCNAHTSRAETGYETYFLSEARTADARRVQQMEDAAAQYEERPRGTGLDFILSDLRQNQYLRESSDWAQMIQNRLREVHPGPNRGVKQAGFAVLVGAFMPAVLVEIGFISNRAEESMLADAQQQETIARQLAAGVRDFFQVAERRQGS
ncbi:N-acetylmuramoyl-L-alanine amidase family protein [Longimicrobium sp.]|uniref:N-acetylmuramoyl-L-alanine amidase family protein n=1 Tax=Longimicrobium sp. TaxID=2029185 RepID=UPI002EDA74AE